MVNDRGEQLTEAGPSVPVEIIGLSEVPLAGDEFNAVEDERMARELADQRREKAKEEVFKQSAKVNLDDLFSHREVPSYGVMNSGTAEALVKRAFEYATGAVTFAFQGGDTPEL